MHDFLAIGAQGAQSSTGEVTGVVFTVYSRGVSTDGDGVVYGSVTGAGALQRGQSSSRSCLYRPFTRRLLHSAGAVSEPGLMPRTYPTTASESENRLIAVTGPGPAKAFAALVSPTLVDAGALGAGSGAPAQCFPFYGYEEDGSHRRENITDWAVEQFQRHYDEPVISKWSIFDYVYGVLHHPGYRAKFADNLKRELPRIPLAPDFRAFQQAGQKLIELHLNYEKLEPWPLEFVEKPGVPLSWRVEKMKLKRDRSAVVVNESLTLAGIPAEVFEYRLGNRSALEWIIDQYQVSTDKRSGITSDPNRPEDEQYVVRLVGQVVRVSVETVRIVNALPPAFAESAPAKKAPRAVPRGGYPSPPPQKSVGHRTNRPA